MKSSCISAGSANGNRSLGRSSDRIIHYSRWFAHEENIVGAGIGQFR